MSAYLEALTLRLAAGLERMPEARRAAHAEYLRSFQQADGGFAGREGGSDLYYSSFALRALALLGELSDDVAGRAVDYLSSRLAGEVPMVDFLSLIYSAMLIKLAAGRDVFEGAVPEWRTSVATALEGLRRDDGGYAKTEEGQDSSVYHSFLVVLAQQLIDVPMVDQDALRRFVLSRRQTDGGFLEMAVMKRSGVNPTAAAIGLLRILGDIDTEVRDEAADFLLEMQTDEGGLRANTRIPIADLLSTFTGLLTMADLDAEDEFDLSAMRAFVRSLERDEGGFHGAPWDTGHDVEYCFYGLGAWSLLHEHEGTPASA